MKGKCTFSNSLKVKLDVLKLMQSNIRVFWNSIILKNVLLAILSKLDKTLENSFQGNSTFENSHKGIMYIQFKEKTKLYLRNSSNRRFCFQKKSEIRKNLNLRNSIVEIEATERQTNNYIKLEITISSHSPIFSIQYSVPKFI